MCIRDRHHTGPSTRGAARSAASPVLGIGAMPSLTVVRFQAMERAVRPVCLLYTSPSPRD
eukprot:6991960-Alexandrium_andersonii.AAC.1